jgi:hypothetical protein
MRLKLRWRDNIDFIVGVLQNSLTKENILESKTLALQEFIRVLPNWMQPYAAFIFVAYLFFHGTAKL